MSLHRHNAQPHDLLCKQLTLVGLQGWTREYRAIPGRRYRVDVAFPALKIAVEVMGGTWTGGRHNRGAGYETDCEKACLLATLGWVYLPVTTDQVRKGQALKWIEKVIGLTSAKPPKANPAPSAAGRERQPYCTISGPEGMRELGASHPITTGLKFARRAMTGAIPGCRGMIGS